ncbi:MAG: S8 family serine peptidase, partial [Dehalococcoidia bacterium]
MSMSLRSGARLLVVLALIAPLLTGDALPAAPSESRATTRVELVATGGDVAAARDLVAAVGGVVEVVSGGRVQALVPGEALPVLEAAREVVTVDRPGIFVPLQTVPALELIGATAWQSAGFTGYQVKVGILDAGFQNYSTVLGNTLPEHVNVRSFRSDGQIGAGTSHGLRAAEVVHQVAPGAELYLVNFSTVTELSAAVDYLAERGVRVVSFSLGYIHNGPGDGTGPVNEIVSRGVAAGQTWSVASGNWAQQHWIGPFTDQDNDSIHEFGSVETNQHMFTAGDLISVSLRWDEPWGGACSDYDLELFAPTGALVRAARGVQDCAQDPVESIQVLATQTGNYGIRVIQAHAEQPRVLELMVVGTPDRGQLLLVNEQRSSLSEPADHPGVITVGALTTAAARTEAPYSSRGPTTDGRFKPNILAPTGAGNSSGVAFGGTSASAPHVAGALALLLEANPTADTGRLMSLVQVRAVGVAAVSGASGARRLDLGSLL